MEARHATRPYRIAIRSLLLALVGALVLYAGTAYAYYGTSASGTGSASVAASRAVLVTATAPTTTLFPGGTADLAVQVTNPNPFPVVITTISPGDGTVQVVGASQCTPAEATVAVTPQTGLDLTVAPGTSTVHVATGASMGPDAANACQGATFDLPVQLRMVKP